MGLKNIHSELTDLHAAVEMTVVPKPLPPQYAYDHASGHRLSDGKDMKDLVDTGKLKGYEMDEMKEVEDGDAAGNMEGMEDAENKVADTKKWVVAALGIPSMGNLYCEQW
ncbi:MAG: hypothetical protein LQ339_000213 [Xanthoria mediterranea]|nr:MAG: hypothetical protein LQ339_000213 [Xanthoria mediterranea]